MISLIVAVDRNWAIGNKGDLLLTIPADMKFFRETTTDNVVIMGRKTLESFPGGKPLINRVNIVVTKNKAYNMPGVIVVNDIESALNEGKKYSGKNIYVIGGGTIYEQMLPYCEEAHVTYIDYSYEADTFFPNLDQDENWYLEGESEEQTHFDVEFYFRRYLRK